jgi:hypothetical protein
MNETPNFRSLDEAVEFWETHDSADFWDGMEEVDFEVELRQSLLTDRPIVLAYRPNSCPKCGAVFQDTVIEYLINNGGRLLIVRDLPVLRCEGDGHLFILEETVDRLEHLINLERLRKVKPTTTLTIPIFEFVTK